MEQNEHPVATAPIVGGIQSGDQVRNRDSVGIANHVEVANLRRAGIPDAGELAETLRWLIARA